MTKIIAITGASGSQGGGVANVFLKTPGWKVRAITRNTSSDKAKDLASRGAEVVQANFDDEDVLAKAFEGVHAVFGVTNFWEHLYTGRSQSQSGEIEEEQAMKLARAVARTSTVEHYIWSTLPSSERLTKGKIEVPHMDYKAKVDDRIKKELPELAKKTTFLFFGYYPSNMAFFPLLKPFEYPGANGKYVQVMPTPADAKVPVSGDMTVTPGIWVRQILANAPKTLGKYASVAPEIMTFGEILKVWSEVTGRPSVYFEVTKQQYEELWGVGGGELVQQFAFGEMFPDWADLFGDDFLTKEDLGISEEGIGLRGALERLKAFL